MAELGIFLEVETAVIIGMTGLQFIFRVSATTLCHFSDLAKASDTRQISRNSNFQIFAVGLQCFDEMKKGLIDILSLYKLANRDVLIEINQFFY